MYYKKPYWYHRSNKNCGPMRSSEEEEISAKEFLEDFKNNRIPITGSTLYKVGTKFIRRNSKRNDIETIQDIYTTRNIKNSIVKQVYVTSHEFLGATVYNHEVPLATVARGKIVK